MADENEVTKRASQDDDEDKPERKRAKEDFPALVRPIIFICNDGFAKPLYPLKDICLRLKVLACSRNRVHERLDQILRTEGFRTNVINAQIDRLVAGVIA